MQELKSIFEEEPFMFARAVSVLALCGAVLYLMYSN